jgi:hypothetical protein
MLNEQEQERFTCLWKDAHLAVEIRLHAMVRMSAHYQRNP